MAAPHSGKDREPAGRLNPGPRRRYILRVTVGYALFGVLWIGFSDKLLLALVDTAAIHRLSTAKGIFFVLVTAALLFVALRGVPEEGAAEPGPPRLERLLAPPLWPRAWLHVFAVLVSVGMLLVRSGIGVSFSAQSLLIIFMFPVILSAIAGGLGPGLTATLIIALGAAHCLPPANSFLIAAPHDIFQWGFLAANGVLISILSEILHRLWRQTEAGRRLQAVTLASIGDGVITTDPGGLVSFLNPKAEELTGWSCGEAMGRPLTTVFRVVNEQSRQPVEDPVHKVLATGEVVGLANHTVLLARDGRELPVQDSGAPIRLADGALLGVVLVFRDDSERRRAENALQTSETTYRSLFENMLNSVVHCRVLFENGRPVDYEYLASNPAFAEVTGISEPVVGRRISEIIPGYCQHNRESLEMFGSVALSGIPTRWEHYLPELGRWFAFSIYSPARGEVVIVTENISERKSAEAALRDSLAEKVALLKEIHHRVKNNLQIVASLLNLQAGQTTSPEAVAALRDTRNRVHSMALLHEMLYRSESLARINLAAYVEKLCSHLLRSFGQTAAERVRVERRIAAVSLPLEQAVPCGLIINELITNALKYGYPDGKTGRVAVELALAGGRLDLSVSDDGEGLPQGFAPAALSTLGLQLVMNLAGQLGGELGWERAAGGGAIFRVSFPAPVLAPEPAPQVNDYSATGEEGEAA